MANSLTPQDAYVLINSIAEQATGQTDLVATDTSSFVAVGETLLRTGTENTLNAISTVISKTIFSVRPYKSKFDSLRVSRERWGAQVRKIVTLYKGAEATTDMNNNLNSPLTDGSSVDMYKVNKPLVMQLNIYGTKLLQKSITRFKHQLDVAFSSETEFIAFIDAIMTEFANEIEILNEEKARATALNYIAGVSAMGTGEVDLVAEFNATYNTTYTRDELLTTYFETFLKFVVATIKKYSDRMTDITSLYHAQITGAGTILRHTPKEKQKMLMYAPFYTDAKANVMSGIFNPDMLEIGDFEGVNFWQSPEAPTEIKIKPNILDVATGESKTSTLEIDLPYVLGALYDVEAMGILEQFDYASTTPFNSAGGYYNMYYHWKFNSYNDFTENGIIFVLGAGGE